ncbi:MAG: hypothetical protein IPL35_17600 [Sphingobacteriales bacterium]|nr:hypothetical protein [Sphingobacteriales bacterium]
MTDYLEGDTEKLKRKTQKRTEVEHIKMLRQIAEARTIKPGCCAKPKPSKARCAHPGLRLRHHYFALRHRRTHSVCANKGFNLLVTQYDNSLVESAGLLKMDFLGLKTLTIIRDAIENINKQHQIPPINPDEIL